MLFVSKQSLSFRSNNFQCLPKCDERTCKITGNNFAVITAVDLIIGKIIEAAIQEGKGELKGVPSSQIVPYDPSKETDDSNLNDQVTF